ncbi:hypothetical protein ACFR9U_12280 [Halorientalis brevis]|uniref:Uncharacterized protein n=1 Tax=Halorientalis brevis TaxID=1126241 RepID=A0ABD6CEI7_9EURY|nr:hypothetical protein [Halorientalis brevis]
MGIKCSLLGHDFSGSKVEEEREEQGSEVLITIKEVETCDRCGKQRVVSENKEVTSLEAAEDAAADDAEEIEDATDDDAEEPETGSSPSGVTPTPDIDAAEDDAELIGEAEDEDEAPASDDSDAEQEPDHQPDPATTGEDEPDQSVTAADDDAVILGDDDDDEPDREPGEWPDDEPDHGVEADAESESTAEQNEEETTTTEEWPDEFGHDEATKTAPEVEWPEEDEPAKSEWEPTENLTKQIDGADVEPAGSAAITVPEGEFECPECGFRTSVEESSLRAGDFCPDCHRGSLEHRAEDQTRKE